MPRSPYPTRAVLSADAITTRFPLGLNAAPLTMFGRCMGLQIYAPVAASHMCAVVSADAVTTRVPSGLNSALVTAPVLQGLADRAPVAPSHTRAVLSSEVVTGAPSGLNATLRNASSYCKGLHHFLHCYLQSCTPVRVGSARRIAISVRESITLLTAHRATPRKRPMRPWATKRSRISSTSSIR